VGVWDEGHVDGGRPGRHVVQVRNPEGIGAPLGEPPFDQERPAGRPRTRPDYLLADRAYSSRVHRSLLRRRGIPHTIAEPDDQKANRRRKGAAGGRPVGFDAAPHVQRNTVERGFCQLK
jgi:hypothetical protein